MKKCIGIIIFVMTLISGPAQATKVDSVQTLLKKECNKAVSYEEAQYWVRALFLTCIPDTDVKIEDQCTVKCLKTGIVSR